MLRMAPLALSTALATAPGLAGAQVQDQLDALQQAIRICSDPTVMPGDWNARLEGWDKVAPPTDLAGRLAADREFYGLIYDPVGRGSLSPDEAESLLAEMSVEIAEEIEAADFGNSDDGYALHFYRHPSNWLLVLELKADDPVRSTCMLSHDAPGAAVIAHLEAPLMQTQPFATIGGRGMQVDANIADGTFDGTDLGYYIFLKDATVPSTGIDPEIDPLRLASAASMTIHNYASAREGK